MKKSKLTNIATDRLKKIMLSDRLMLDTDAIKMLRADIARVLTSYFDYNPEKLKLDIYLDEDKKYRLDIFLSAEAVLPVKTIK